MPTSSEHKYKRLSDAVPDRTVRELYGKTGIVSGAFGLASTAAATAGYLIGGAGAPAYMGLAFVGAVGAGLTAVVSMGRRLDASLSAQEQLRAQAGASLLQAAKTSAWLRNVNEMSNDFYWELDGRFAIKALEGQHAIKSGVISPDFVGRCFWNLVVFGMDHADWEAHRKTLNAGESFKDLRFGLANSKGNICWVSLSGRPLLDGKRQVVGYCGIGRDISEAKAAQEQMDAMAVTDPLTDLPNRQFLLARLPNALASAKRHGHNVLLCAMDTVSFGSINAELGLLIGDQVLKELGQRIKASVRDSDMVVRMEGDKFAVLFENLSSDMGEASANAKQIVSKLQARLTAPYLVGHKLEPIECPVRIGYTLGEVAEDSVSDIVNRSQAALDIAKQRGITSFGWGT